MKQLMLTQDDAENSTVLAVAQVPQVEIVTIEPVAATALLNANTKNRTLSEARVAAHVHTLTSGRFVLTNDAITIDTDGLIVNGAHRLTACERTGIPITVLFLQGVPGSTRDVVDTGMKRTFSQALGIRGDANVTNLGAVTVLHYLYVTGQLTPSGPVGRGPAREALSHDLLMDHLATHPELRYAVKDASTANWFLPNVKRSSVGTFRAITHALDPYEAGAFYDSLKSGEDLHPGMPVLTLRNFLMRADRDTSRFVTLGVMIKAWNAHRKGAELRSVSLKRDEKFPEAK